MFLPESKSMYLFRQNRRLKMFLFPSEILGWCSSAYDFTVGHFQQVVRVPSWLFVVIMCTTTLCTSNQDWWVSWESSSDLYQKLAGQPGVARAFALRAEGCRFAPLPGSAQRSRFPITHPSVMNTLPYGENLLFFESNLHNSSFGFWKKKVTRVKHHCVHYRQKEESKEKKS